MNLRTKLMLSTAVMAASLTSAAEAQPTDSSQTVASEAPRDIIVTGTRIQAQPTPVTVQTAKELADSNPTSVVEALVDLPQFKNSNTNSSQNNFTIGTPTGSFLNLRGLGASRTLNPLDGVRIPPNTYRGATNVEILPLLLLQRVDMSPAAPLPRMALTPFRGS